MSHRNRSTHPSNMSLLEAIQEFKKYSMSTASLCERTEQCLKEILEKVPFDDGEDERQFLDPSAHLRDVKKQLQRRPSVLFIGERNCGKSSIINELLQHSSLPVHETPCTARIVRIGYAENSYARLIGADGSQGEKVAFESRKLPREVKELIEIPDGDRDNKDSSLAIVEVGLNHELLKSGIELIDSPGKNECDALDSVLDDFLQKDTVPLFVYVVNGNMHLRPSDKETVTHLKGRCPQVPFMFVCNKIDITDGAKRHDAKSSSRRRLHSEGNLEHGGNGDKMEAAAANDNDDDDESAAGGSDDDNDGNNHFAEESKKSEKRPLSKGEIVFNQLKENGFLKETEDSWESSFIYHALSAKKIREERRRKEREEATTQFERFESSLHNVLRDVIEKQTRTVVQKLLVAQETFVNVIQVQRNALTEKAVILPEIFQKAVQVEAKMFESFSAIVTRSQESRSTILNTLKRLKEEFKREAGSYKVPNADNLQRECETMVRTEIGALENYPDIVMQMETADLALGQFVSDMKGRIIEKAHNALNEAVESMMENSVCDITEAMVSFVGDLGSPAAIRILEDSYDIPCIADGLEARDKVNVVLDGLLDSIKKAVKIALRKAISEPLCELSLNANLQIRDKDVRRNIVEDLFAIIQGDPIVDTVCEACTTCLSEMREMFRDALAKLESLKRAFSKGPLASQLREFRINFTPQIRKMMVEGIAMQNLLTRGPADLGSPITHTRHSIIYDCTSERWCSSSPSGHCAVKVIERKRLSEAHWSQTAVDLVNMMDITRRFGWSPSNLLRLYGWLQPEPDVLFVVMEKAEKGLVSALREGLSPMIRMNVALNVATGLKVIHDADYAYEDLKPENILLMHDGTAKINMTKPEDPFTMTALGEPFHISPEMYQFHGRGFLACLSYDIYAFGMLFWVLCEGSGRNRPRSYRDMTTRQHMETAVTNGVFPERPPGATDESWTLMETCWQRRLSVTIRYILADVTRIRNAVWQ